jgi:hypothetical protein
MSLVCFYEFDEYYLYILYFIVHVYVMHIHSFI